MDTNETTEPSLHEQIRPHLSKPLRVRLGIYLAVSLVLAVFVIYNSFKNNIPGIFAVGGVIIGLLIGFAVSRMHKISWNEQASKVMAKIDVFGFIILILYVIFEIFREKIVGRFVNEADVAVTSFSILAGVMYGRVLGIRGKIIRVLEEKDLL